MDTPLYLLAANHNLPDDQAIDGDTLAWIEQEGSKRDFTLSDAEKQKASIFTEKLIKSWDYTRSLPLPVAYYARGVKARDTIHGDLHSYRVSILCSCLQGLGLDNEGCIAGLYHGIGRTNDKTDEKHGERSANILRKAVSLDWSGLNRKSILGAINCHEMNTGDEKQKPLLLALKTADALDRYRLPKTKWWPNVDYMDIVPEEYIFKIAYWLVAYSERSYLTSHNAETSINEAILEIRGVCEDE